MNGLHSPCYVQVLQSLYQSSCDWLYQEHQLQLVLPCSTAFSVLKQSRRTYPSFHFLSILLCGQLGQQSSQFWKFSFLLLLLLLIILMSGRLAKIRWPVCISKSRRNLCVSFSCTDSWLGIYHLFIWPNFNFLPNSQWITLSTQLSLVLYSFCGNFADYVIDHAVFITI